MPDRQQTEITDKDINRLFDLEARYNNVKGIIALGATLGANNGLNAAEKKRIDRVPNELGEVYSYRQEPMETGERLREIRKKPLAERVRAIAEERPAMKVTETTDVPTLQRDGDGGRER